MSECVRDDRETCTRTTCQVIEQDITTWPNIRSDKHRYTQASRISHFLDIVAKENSTHALVRRCPEKNKKREAIKVEERLR